MFFNTHSQTWERENFMQIIYQDTHFFYIQAVIGSDDFLGQEKGDWTVIPYIKYHILTHLNLSMDLRYTWDLYAKFIF